MSDQPSRDDIILSFDPFSDDAESRTITNKMLVTRKAHECYNCREPIPTGTRVRSMTQSWEGEIGTWRWCPACCDAMVDEWDPEKWDDATDLQPYAARSSLVRPAATA